MAMFSSKKPDWEQKLSTEVGAGGAGAPPAPAAGTVAAAPRPAYGIQEAIQLMRTLPVDQNAELVVRVVRATLASLNVQLSVIIDDATRKQKLTQDRITAEHGQIADLEKQLEVHRKEIASLEADLKETTAVKERLQQAEKLAGLAGAPGTPPLGVSAQSPVTSATMIGHKPD